MAIAPAVCPDLKDPAVQYRLAEKLISNNNLVGSKDIRPAVLTGAGDFVTRVKSDFYVSKLNIPVWENGLMTVETIFRQRWSDRRLAYKDLDEICAGTNTTGTSILIPLSMKDSIWTPDLYISNQIGSVERYSLFKPNIMIRVNEEGDVLLSQRLSFTVSCPELKTTGTCSFHIESYSHKADELVVEWKEKNPIYYPFKGTPGCSKSHIGTSGAELCQVEALRCDSVTPAGTYSCIEAKFRFE